MTELLVPPFNATTTGYFLPNEDGQSAGLSTPSSNQSAIDRGIWFI